MPISDVIGKRVRVVKAHPFGGGESSLNGKAGIIVDAYGVSSLVVIIDGEIAELWFSLREVDIL